MKNNKIASHKISGKSIHLIAVVGLIFWISAHCCNAQSNPANEPSLSPDLQDVVNLSQKQMSDDVIIDFIKNSGKTYKPSAEDIINLKSQGISENVIRALLEAKRPDASSNQASAPLVTPQQSSPPQTSDNQESHVVTTNAGTQGGQEINFQYFHDQLEPFGTWQEVPDMGQVWIPSADITGISPDWRPYYDNGEWVQTSNGLYWQSDYTWGDIPFHYGRWSRNTAYGWVWVPDYTWGPSWVFWRQDANDGYIGWAALPPGAVFKDGVFLYNGIEVADDYDFGLDQNWFVFVGYSHFHEHFARFRGREWRYHVGSDKLHTFYKQSVVRNEFRKDKNGYFVNNGIGLKRVEKLTKIENRDIQERNPVGDKDKEQKNQTRTSSVNSTTRGGDGSQISHHNLTANNQQNPNNRYAQQVNPVYRPPTPPPTFQNQKQSTSNNNQKNKKNNSN